MSRNIQYCAIPEEILLDNRERFKGEIAQAIYQLMCEQNVTRSRLAKMLGCSRSRITHMLSGEKDNFQADTIADVFLILGRAAHLTLGTDPEEFRLPVDEGNSADTYVQGLGVILNGIWKEQKSQDEQEGSDLAEWRDFGGTDKGGSSGIQAIPGRSGGDRAEWIPEAKVSSSRRPTVSVVR